MTDPIASALASAADLGIAFSFRYGPQGWSVHATRTIERELSLMYRNAVGFAIDADLDTALTLAIERCLAEAETYTVPVRQGLGPSAAPGPSLASLLAHALPSAPGLPPGPIRRV